MVQAVPDSSDWQDISADQIDLASLPPQLRSVLNLDGMTWKHAQTEHFVVHYEQAIFARKVARMGEFFYQYIREDLKGSEDRVDRRSHLFIFRNEKKWKEFIRTEPSIESWAFSYVKGADMYLQQADNTSSSGNVLAHEMTHVIVDRFYLHTLPIWLNEGLAEYYGEFAYSAYKGIKKSKRAQFIRLSHPYPVPELLGMTDYPKDEKKIGAFYETSKWMVGFLLLERPPERFVPYLNQLMDGADSQSALFETYGFSNRGDFEKAFKAFSK